MPVWLGVNLRELSQEWLRTELERTQEFDKHDDTNAIDAHVIGLEEDTDAVNRAFESHSPKRVSTSAKIPNLSAGEIARIERESTSMASSPRRRRRTRYLYWLLCRLGSSGSLTFTLPVAIPERPLRVLAFDPSDSDLPTMTQFYGWQQHLATLALSERTEPNQSKADAIRNREFLAVTAMIAFGGPCGRAALLDLARIRRHEFDPAQRAVWLRDSSGNMVIKLTLHPVQLIALVMYLRASGLPIVAHSSEVKDSKSHQLFPSISSYNGRRTFREWLARTLASADSSKAASEGPSLKGLLAGTRRWMLELYPVYLVSILAGRFQAANISNDIDREPKTQSIMVDEKCRVPMSAREKELRKCLNYEAFRYLATETGIFRRDQVEDLCENWGRLVSAPSEKPPQAGSSSIARDWNLFLLTESLKCFLREGQTNRFNTFKRWWYSGCSLLNALSGRPAWSLTDEEGGALCRSIKPSVVRDVVPLLERIKVVAMAYGLHSAEKVSVVRQNRRQRPVRPRQSPTADQIERIAAYLVERRSEVSSRRNIVAPKALRIYLDLLALGLRKGEALAITARHVDFESNDKEIDLVVLGRKSPAAHRRVPIEQHPHRGCAERILADARALRDKGDADRPMIDAVSGRTYRRHLPTDAPAGMVSIDQLDHALTKAARRCIYDHMTPHGLRHASVTSWLLMDHAVTELIAKYHGHADLPTTFGHYMHGLSLIQARDLERFLGMEENRIWIAAPDALRILNISKQALYKRYNSSSKMVLGADSLTVRGTVIRRPGKPRYVDSLSLSRVLASRATLCDASTRSSPQVL